MSTVRLGGADKERLRRLQQAWKRTRGEQPTQEQLLGKALEYTERHKDEFLAEVVWRPLGRRQIAALRRRVQRDVGHVTDLSADIDRTVVGE